MKRKEMLKIRKKLIEYRRSLGFTQEMLGEKLGCSKATYNQIEIGHRKGTIDFWFKLQEVLCLTNDELVTFMKDS